LTGWQSHLWRFSKNTALNIRLGNDLNELRRLLALLNRFKAQARLNCEDYYALRLTLDELITNIIRHGYSSDDEGEILVQLERRGDEAIITVEDQARPFNPLHHKEPDLSIPFEEREIGGLGIFLCRSMMDVMEYHRSQGRNQIICRRRLGLRR